MIACNGVNGKQATPDSPASGIIGAFGLTLAEDGLLPAAFMVGLMASSPVFAELAKRRSALRLMAAGLGIWSVAVAATGAAVGLRSLLLARAAVGAGEASFVSLASPFIDDAAPPARKSRWLAAFYLCIPVGVALGYVVGGVTSSALGWRAPFFVSAGLMLPFVAVCLLLPPVHLRGTCEEDEGSRADLERRERQGVVGSSGVGAAHASAAPDAALADPGLASASIDHDRAASSTTVGATIGSGSTSRSSSLRSGHHAPANGGALAARAPSGLSALASDLRLLSRHAVYVSTVAAMTAWAAVLGTLAFYAPRAARDLFGIQPDEADASFGGITVIAGVAGTLSGGLLLDRLGGGLATALRLSAVSNAASFVLLAVAFAFAPSFAPFMSIVGVGMACMFASQAPSNAALLWSVPPGLRAVGVSASIVLMHVLGDVPGPPILGAIQDRVGKWRVTLTIWTALLLLAALAYAVGAAAALAAPDYRTAAAVPAPVRRSDSGEDDRYPELSEEDRALIALED